MDSNATETTDCAHGDHEGEVVTNQKSLLLTNVDANLANYVVARVNDPFTDVSRVTDLYTDSVSRFNEPSTDVATVINNPSNNEVTRVNESSVDLNAGVNNPLVNACSVVDVIGKTNNLLVTSDNPNINSTKGGSSNCIKNKVNLNCLTANIEPLSMPSCSNMRACRKRQRGDSLRKSARIESLTRDNCELISSKYAFVDNLNLYKQTNFSDSSVLGENAHLFSKHSPNAPVLNKEILVYEDKEKSVDPSLELKQFSELKKIKKFNSSEVFPNLSAQCFRSEKGSISIGHVIEKLKLRTEDFVFGWIISNIKTKYKKLNDKFDKQFEALRELDICVKKLPLELQEDWQYVLWNTKYVTPISFRGWSLIFGPYPPKICSKFFFPFLQFDSDTRKTRSVGARKRRSIGGSLKKHVLRKNYYNSLISPETPLPITQRISLPETSHIIQNLEGNLKDEDSKLSVKTNKIANLKSVQKIKLYNSKLLSKENEIQILQRNMIKKNMMIKKLQKKINILKCINEKKEIDFKFVLKGIKRNYKCFSPFDKAYFDSLIQSNLKEEDDEHHQVSYLPVDCNEEGTGTIKSVSAICPPKDFDNQNPQTALIDLSEPVKSNAVTMQCKDSTVDVDKNYELPVLQNIIKISNAKDKLNSKEETCIIQLAKKKFVESTSDFPHLNATGFSLKGANFLGDKIELYNQKNSEVESGNHKSYQSLSSNPSTILPSSYKTDKLNDDSNTLSCQNGNTAEQDKDRNLNNNLSDNVIREVVANCRNEYSSPSQNASELIDQQEKVKDIDNNVHNKSANIVKIQNVLKENECKLQDKNLVKNNCNEHDNEKWNNFKIEVEKLYRIMCKHTHSGCEIKIDDIVENYISLCQEKANQLNSHIKNIEYQLSIYVREIKALQTDLINNENVLKNELNEKETLIGRYNELKKQLAFPMDKRLIAFSTCQCKKDDTCKKSVYIRLKSVPNSESGKCDRRECLTEIQNIREQKEKSQKELENAVTELTKVKKEVIDRELGIKKLETCINMLKENSTEILQQLSKETDYKIKCEFELQDCKKLLLQVQGNNQEMKLMLGEKEQELLNNVRIFQSQVGKLNEVINEKENILRAKNEKCLELEADLFAFHSAISNLRANLGIGIDGSENISVSKEIQVLTELQDEIKHVQKWYVLNLEELKKKQKLIHKLKIEVRCIQKEKGKYSEGNRLLKKKLFILNKNMAEIRSEIQNLKDYYIQFDVDSQHTLDGNFSKQQNGELGPVEHPICDFQHNVNHEKLYFQDAVLETNEKIIDLNTELSKEKQRNEENLVRIKELECNCQELTELLNQEHSEASRQLDLQLAMYCATAERYQEQMKRIQDRLGGYEC